MRQPPPPDVGRSQDPSLYFRSDTIAAISTATGGAIAIVRISGKGAFDAFRSLAPGQSLPEPRLLERVALQDPRVPQDPMTLRSIDEALAVRFVAPQSFTGEDILELHLHGSAFIASRVMECLMKLGIRQALPGEFSFRAVRNGKLSLSQAVAVADLIAATSGAAVELALEKLSGSQNQLIHRTADELKRLVTLAEAGIDFSDQDIDEVSLPRLRAAASASVTPLYMLVDSYRRGFALQDGIRVSFIGLPNAGKSSFFNRLLGEDRSIVSNIPGTTRDVVGERFTLSTRNSSFALRLEDTAGLRHSSDPVERIGIEKTAESVRRADLVLLLADVTSDSFSALFEEWTRLGAPLARTIGIGTKADLASPAQIERFRLANLPPLSWVLTSAVTGEGISDAAALIASACEKLVHRTPGEVLLTRLDQRDAVESALEHLRRAERATEIDLFASDLRQCLRSLGPLIGETTSDEILGKIFSEFCIGK